MRVEEKASAADVLAARDRYVPRGISASDLVVTRAWGVVNKQGGGIRFVDAKFTKPVKVGETVTATGKVKRKHHHGPGKNWVQIAIEAKDSTGDLIGLAEVGYNLPD